MALQFQGYGDPFARQKLEQQNDLLRFRALQEALGAVSGGINNYKQNQMRQSVLDMDKEKFGMQKQEFDRQNEVTPFPQEDVFASNSLTQKNPNPMSFPGAGQQGMTQMGSQMAMPQQQTPVLGMPQNKLSMFQGGSGQPQVSADLVALHKQQNPQFSGMGGQSQPPGMPPPGFSPKTYEESLRNRKMESDIKESESRSNYFNNGKATKSNMQTSSMESSSPQEQSLARAMVEGRVRPSDIGFRDRGRIISLANEYADKNGIKFQSYGGDVKAGMAKNLAFGKMGMNALSLNTALGHVGDAMTAYTNVENTDQAWLNQPINYLREKTNNPYIIAIGLNLNALRGELANVFKNSGGTDQEIASWSKYLNEDLTPSQYIAAAQKIDELLTSRLDALQYQQSNVMDHPISERSLISPKGQGIREKIQAHQTGSSGLMWKGRPIKDTPANREWLQRQQGGQQ